jgi:hypothetical protein
MNAFIDSLPIWLSAVAYAILVLGVVFVVGFIVDYTVHTRHIDGIGRHMVAMSANVGAFFVLYLLLALLPDLPGRGFIRFTLLIAIVANSGWRWRLYRKQRRAYLADPTHPCPACGRGLVPPALP